MSPERLVKADVSDTRFHSASARLAQGNRPLTCTREINSDLEIASILKMMDGGAALLFPSVKSHGVPVIGNLLGSQKNCEAAFGADFPSIRNFVDRAIGNPIAPRVVASAPAQNVVLKTARCSSSCASIQTN